jgi:anti-sigma factor RsiW
MCPDRELLSAWLDGEVPSPWRETLERHVRSCAACTGAVKSMDMTRALFAAEVATFGATAEAVRARVAGRIASASPRQSGRLYAFGGRRLSIPAPLAAAAAVAIMAMGLALAASGHRNADLRLAVRRSAEASSVATSGMGIESVIDFISRQNSAVNINITLPAEAFGVNAGEPFIVREADYQNGIRR